MVNILQRLFSRFRAGQTAFLDERNMGDDKATRTPMVIRRQRRRRKDAIAKASRKFNQKRAKGLV